MLLTVPSTLRHRSYASLPNLRRRVEEKKTHSLLYLLLMPLNGSLPKSIRIASRPIVTSASDFVDHLGADSKHKIAKTLTVSLPIIHVTLRAVQRINLCQYQAFLANFCRFMQSPAFDLSFGRRPWNTAVLDA